MADSRLPDEVRALVQNHLASMPHLEALLLLSGSPGESLAVEAVAGQIGVSPDAAAKVLRDLHASLLVAEEGAGGRVRYRFAPGDESLRRAAESLSDMYARFPVQVIRAVYERPPSAVQQLADAFRLRN
jgi:DNA-binding IscR family transcriptional regulator